MKLFLAPSNTPHGNVGQAFAVVLADSKEEAAAKIGAKLDDPSVIGRYVPRQQRLRGIAECLAHIEEVEDGILIEDGLR